MTQIDAMKVRDWYELLTDTYGPSTTLAVKGDLVTVINEARTPYNKFPAHFANPFALTVKAPEKTQGLLIAAEDDQSGYQTPQRPPAGNLCSSRAGWFCVFRKYGRSQLNK